MRAEEAEEGGEAEAEEEDVAPLALHSIDEVSLFVARTSQ